MTEQAKNPRLRILELPSVYDGDKMTTPFLLVFDRVPEDLGEEIAERREDLTDWSSAVGVLSYSDEIDLGDEVPESVELHGGYEAVDRVTDHNLLAERIRAELRDELMRNGGRWGHDYTSRAEVDQRLAAMDEFSGDK